MNSIATLMTCFNRKDKTLKSLESLFRQYAGTDVYLVDDGCTDGTGAAVKQQFPQVNVIQGTGNLFWNRGMHLAWKTAAAGHDYDFYFWLNDDTILFPDAIEELLACSESEHHKSIICGATQATDNPDEITYGGWRPENTILKPNGQKQSCDYINGNILLVPRYVYSKIGTNDPVFHHTMGDFDYGVRARKQGIQSIVAPKVLGVCDEHATMDAWCNPEVPLFKRLKLLYTPLGNHPIQHFILEKRHYGVWTSCFHFATIHLRAIFPSLWKNKV